MAIASATVATIASYAIIAAAAVGAGTSIYSATKGSPTLPTPTPPPPNLAPPSLKPPEFASVANPDDAEGKARAGAARKQRDLESRRSNASTILTTPLGVSTPAGNVKSSVLGR